MSQLKSTEYRRFKHVLNAAKHPTFIGRQQVASAIRNGGGLVFTFEGEDVAVALVNPRLNVIVVLSVTASHQGHGMGSAVLKYLQANFARVVESAAAFFERNGYVKIGELKQGRKLRTQIMVRKDLIGLAGRIARIFSTV